MSQDDGWLIRQNEQGKYVLQNYCASADMFPPIENATLVFDTLDEAVKKYAEIDNCDYPSEYGLSVRIDHNQKVVKMETAKYARNPFYVDAVQVTEENIEEVAKWCQGEVKIDEQLENPNGSAKYILVKVHRPLNDRQTRAFFGDWVLYAGSGYKVYTNKAFTSSFHKLEGTEDDKAVQFAKPQPSPAMMPSTTPVNV